MKKNNGEPVKKSFEFLEEMQLGPPFGASPPHFFQDFEKIKIFTNEVEEIAGGARTGRVCVCVCLRPGYRKWLSGEKLPNKNADNFGNVTDISRMRSRK